MRFGAAIIGSLLPTFSVVGLAQVPAQPSTALAFEVASIREQTGRQGGPAPASPDRFDRTNVTLGSLIREAYDLELFELVGGPDWLNTVVFSVAAKAPFAAAPDQMRQMLRRLLEERFALRAHTETRNMSGYALTLARNDGRLGPNLTRTPYDCAAVDAERTKRGERAPRIPSSVGERPICTTFIYRRGSPAGSTILRYVTSGTTMSELAEWLSSPAQTTVTDQTGMTGQFDADLEFSRTVLPRTVNDPDAPPSVFTAVEEQLGLKLEATRGPVEVLVIDSVERPTSN